MSLPARSTASGFQLPSIHSLPPFYILQPNIQTQANQITHWIRLILGFARHERLFYLRLDDITAQGSEWSEIFHNSQINRRMQPSLMQIVISTMVTQNSAAWDPPKQNRVALIYWRTPEDWASVLHDWVTSTGQLQAILTLYEIADPPIESPLSGIPEPLLRKAINVLAKSGRAQLIEGSDGGGARFLPAN